MKVKGKILHEICSDCGKCMCVYIEDTGNGWKVDQRAWGDVGSDKLSDIWMWSCLECAQADDLHWKYHNIKEKELGFGWVNMYGSKFAPTPVPIYDKYEHISGELLVGQTI